MSKKLRPATIVLTALLFACGFAATVRAQDTLPSQSMAIGAQDRLYAEPKLSGANPFLLSEFQNVQLPVAMGGFSVVALRDQQQWIPGQQQLQLIFDGQIYWFAGPRDRDIFAAAPHEYAPALGGDCVVTYVDTGQRTPGKLEFGLTHARRLYFFAGESERERFRRHPAYYATGDLANEGHCLVSQIDERKIVVGLPETVAIVGGLRYHFAGAHERRLFASDPSHYGVQRMLLTAPDQEKALSADPQAKSAQVHSGNQGMEKAASPRPKEDLEEPDEQHYAMEGYCPVSIQLQGIWVRGSYQNHVDHEGRRYLLAGDKEKKLFLEDPERYAPMLGGDCIVSKADEGKQTPGSVYHTLIYEGKLYLFAGPEQVRAFKADPTRYVEPLVTPQEDAAPVDDQEPSENALRE